MVEIDKLERYNKEVADFFETELLHPEIIIAKDRKEIDKIRKGKGQEVTSFIKALANEKRIIILDEVALKKLSDEKNIFDRLLKHELAHVYYRNLFNIKGRPHWLTEGISIWVEGRREIDRPTKEQMSIKVLKERDEENQLKSFGPGFFMVREIILNYGKNELFKLSKIKDREKMYKKLKEMFPWLK